MSELFIILFLILLNGLFSMSEIALISARKSSLQSDAARGNKAAKTALNLTSNPDKFLSSVQVGITLIGLLTGMFSGSTIASLLSDVLVAAGLSSATALGLAKAIIITIVTYLTIVLGELVPKRIGMSAAEKVAKIMAGPMKLIATICSPIVWLLSKSTSVIIKILGIKGQESKITEEEIKSIIQEGTEEGEVSPVEQDIVENVFTLGELSVSSIMTQRSDIIWLDKDMSEEEVRRTIENDIYEIYPVVDGDLDHIEGVLTLKDFVLNVGKEKFDLKSMTKAPTYFHENMNVYTILEEMKKKRISRALVCDEFGACSGIITLKDILEGLIGEVDDDHEKEEEIVERQEGDGWLVDGKCTMYDFLSYFEMEDDMEDFEYTTIAGLILDCLGNIPEVGQTTEWGGFTFEVVDMDGPRIDKIIVKKIQDDDSDKKKEGDKD